MDFVGKHLLLSKNLALETTIHNFASPENSLTKIFCFGLQCEVKKKTLVTFNMEKGKQSECRLLRNQGYKLHNNWCWYAYECTCTSVHLVSAYTGINLKLQNATSDDDSNDERCTIK